MGRASRDKGLRGERRIVNALRDANIPAVRVPLSGATDFQKGDVKFLGKYIAEVKARKAFPKWLSEYLGSNDALFLVEDRQEPLVVLRLSTFTEMVR